MIRLSATWPPNATRSHVEPGTQLIAHWLVNVAWQEGSAKIDSYSKLVELQCRSQYWSVKRRVPWIAAGLRRAIVGSLGCDRGSDCRVEACWCPYCWSLTSHEQESGLTEKPLPRMAQLVHYYETVAATESIKMVRTGLQAAAKLSLYLACHRRGHRLLVRCNLLRAYAGFCSSFPLCDLYERTGQYQQKKARLCALTSFDFLMIYSRSLPSVILAVDIRLVWRKSCFWSS